jgi:hypothetical protein
MPARAPQLQPSLASYQRLQRNPGTLRSDRALLEEFEAAPWLLPPRTPLLPYTGVHNLDSLLALRARPAGKHKKAIAFLLFSKRWAVMAQNSSEWLRAFRKARKPSAVGGAFPASPRMGRDVVVPGAPPPPPSLLPGQTRRRAQLPGGDLDPR